MSTHDDGTGSMRRCGRCRRFFPLDDADDVTARATWWLCPPCHEALLGKGTLKERTTLVMSPEGAEWSSLN
jgi:hypothetical protein